MGTDRSVTLTILGGTTVNNAAAQAQSIADDAKCEVRFEFNGVDCVALPGGNAELLSGRQQEAQRSRFRVFSSMARKDEIEKGDER